MKTINIYISMKDKQDLIKLKNRFHLSFSTIIDIIALPMDEICRKNKLYEKENLEYRKNCYKTTIKPQKFNNNMTPRQYSIATKLFIRKIYCEYLKPEELQRFNNMIYRQFEQTYDENWNGNYLARYIPRFIKANKEYVRKVLDD